MHTGCGFAIGLQMQTLARRDRRFMQSANFIPNCNGDTPCRCAQSILVPAVESARPALCALRRFQDRVFIAPENLTSIPRRHIDFAVKRLSFSEIKRQEARRRMAAVRQARRSPQAATALQNRASLVGDGAKWRITNWKQAARAIANQA